MNFDLEKHLREEHRTTPFSAHLREIVYGGHDGIITTFAVVAGFTGAQSDPQSLSIPIATVLLFGLANLLADGLSMSLGSFLSLRANQDVYQRTKMKERHEIIHDPENEFAETIEILKRRKFSDADAHNIASLYRKNPSYWTEFMMNDELHMPNPEHEKPVAVAVVTLFSFLVFGSIPLLPYMFLPHSYYLFYVSVVCTAGALLLLGILRATVSNRHPVRGMLETLLLGGLAATVAYAIGTLFQKGA